jgi:hypothetical protein
VATQDQWPTQISDTEIISGQSTVAREPAVVTAVPPAAVARSYPFGRSLWIGLAILAAAGLGILGAVLFSKHHQAAVTTGPKASPASTRQRVAVPAVTGFDRQDAAAELKAAGLKMKTRVRTTGPADGAIVSQQPAASSHVVAGSTVTLVIDRAAGAISKPKAVPTTTQATTTTPQTSAVPQVKGMAEQAAVQSLYRAGVVPLIVFVPSQDELGTVEGQAKPSGTQVAAQTPMQITISRGPGQNPNELVPSVVGKSFNSALASIQANGLRFIYLKQPVTTQNQAGTIISQTPEPAAGRPPDA